MEFRRLADLAGLFWASFQTKSHKTKSESHLFKELQGKLGVFKPWPDESADRVWNPKFRATPNGPLVN